MRYRITILSIFFVTGNKIYMPATNICTSSPNKTAFIKPNAGLLITFSTPFPLPRVKLGFTVYTSV